MKKRFAAAGTGLAAGALAAMMAMNTFAAQITEDKAKSIALEHAGRTSDQVIYIRSLIGSDDGWVVYDVKFLTADYKEYEYEVNGNTGEITGWEYDIKKSLAGDAAGGASQQTKAVSGIEAAKAIAVKQAGLSLSDVAWGEVETDYEDGRMVYEGEFFYGAMEYEFEIDAATGQMRKWEMESMYD